MTKHIGYASSEPCDVCGKYNHNESEPRFGYTVCKDHYDITPVKVSEYKNKKESSSD
jgi:hypothetical protein